MTIHDNLPLTESSYAWCWSDRDLSYIRQYFSDITFMRDQLSDDEIERTVRRWIWRNCCLYGSDESPGPVEQTSSAILAWWIENQKLNGGRGPKMSCGTIAALYIGILAAYGILARKVLASRSDGGRDNTAEYWSPGHSGWVHVLPSLNSHFEHDGRRLSYWAWSTLERQFGRNGSFDVVSLTGGKPFAGDDPTNAWEGFIESAMVEAGNCNPIEMTHYLSIGVWFDRPESLCAYCPMVNANGPADILPPGNALHIDTNDTQAILTTSMPGFDRFEMLESSSGQWQRLPGPMITIAGASSKFRAVGKLGQTSQSVLVER